MKVLAAAAVVLLAAICQPAALAQDPSVDDVQKLAAARDNDERL